MAHRTHKFLLFRILARLQIVPPHQSFLEFEQVLANVKDEEAWNAAVHRVSKSQTRLGDNSNSISPSKNHLPFSYSSSKPHPTLLSACFSVLPWILLSYSLMLCLPDIFLHGTFKMILSSILQKTLPRHQSPPASDAPS